MIPEDFDVYLGLEEAAAQLTGYRSELVPGLLQTEDYARTLIRDGNPGMVDEEIERRVQVRMSRQVLLTRPTAAPTLSMVLNEAVLRRPVGGSPVMVRQLERLRESSELPTVSLRVVPFDAGLHYSAIAGHFVILRFPQNYNGQETEPPTVYVEGFTGSLYLDKPHEIEHYTTAFTNTWESALDEAASRKLITRLARELTP